MGRNLAYFMPVLDLLVLTIGFPGCACAVLVCWRANSLCSTKLDYLQQDEFMPCTIRISAVVVRKKSLKESKAEEKTTVKTLQKPNTKSKARRLQGSLKTGENSYGIQKSLYNMPRNT
jgi:hypothetical protein